MTSSAPGIRTAAATSGGAASSWLRWLGAGSALVVVAVVAAFWTAGGSRLVLGTLGLLAVARGAALFRGEAAGRPLGLSAAVAGLAGIAVAATSTAATGWVLVIGMPLLLLASALGLLPRRGAARRGGQVLLVWTLLFSALLVAAAVGPGWARVVGLATVTGALALAGLGVALLVGAAGQRATARTPAPARPAACGGCACGAGGCGAIG